MNIDELTIGQIKEIKRMVGSMECTKTEKPNPHPMLNRRCLVRTYSAGVHIGDVVFVDGMECKLENALRLWKWEDGGLSLSAVANNGIVKGRLSRNPLFIRSFVPAEGSKTGLELPGIVDQVVSMVELKNDEGQPYRAFVCHKLNPWGYPAGDRSGRLAMIEKPHLGELMEKISGPVKPITERLNYAMPIAAEGE